MNKKKTFIKKPTYCKDRIEPPYKICWTYAFSIKNFEKDTCSKCPLYDKGMV